MRKTTTMPTTGTCRSRANTSVPGGWYFSGDDKDGKGYIPNAGYFAGTNHLYDGYTSLSFFPRSLFKELMPSLLNRSGIPCLKGVLWQWDGPVLLPFFCSAVSHVDAVRVQAVRARGENLCLLRQFYAYFYSIKFQ